MKTRMVRIDWRKWERTDDGTEDHLTYEASEIATTLHVPRSLKEGHWLGKKVEAQVQGHTLTVIGKGSGHAISLTELVKR